MSRIYGDQEHKSQREAELFGYEITIKSEIGAVNLHNLERRLVVVVEAGNHVGIGECTVRAAMDDYSLDAMMDALEGIAKRNWCLMAGYDYEEQPDV